MSTNMLDINAVNERTISCYICQKQATEMMRELYKEVSDEAEDTFGNGAKVVKQVAEKYGIDLNSDKK
jgi:uncharacterized protein YpuA (DUF1002 family)